MIGPGEEDGSGPGSDLTQADSQTDTPSVLRLVLGVGKLRMNWEPREGVANLAGSVGGEQGRVREISQLS